jgi:hypothetical protein
MLLPLPEISGCQYSADGDDEILPPKWSLDALANKLHVLVKGGGILDNMRLGRQPASRVYTLEAADLAMDNHVTSKVTWLFARRLYSWAPTPPSQPQTACP